MHVFFLHNQAVVTSLKTSRLFSDLLEKWWCVPSTTDT